MPKGWNNGQWPMDRLRQRLAERIERRSVRNDAGCLIWTGVKDRQGYGFSSFGTYQKMIRVHRAAYALRHGLPMVFDGIVCHRCDNPSCVDADHLFLGSHADNVRDKVAKGRQPRGEAHGIAKLTADQVRAIRADSRSQQKIADAYGIAQGTVRDILIRKIWAHVE